MARVIIAKGGDCSKHANLEEKAQSDTLPLIGEVWLRLFFVIPAWWCLSPEARQSEGAGLGLDCAWSRLPAPQRALIP
jgi:hypothetical protein